MLFWGVSAMTLRKYNYACCMDDCDYMSVGSFKELVAHIHSEHGIFVAPYHCPVQGCNYYSKGAVARHYRTVHVKLTAILCSQPGCDYITNRSDNFRRHCSTIHSNTLHVCDYPGCHFISKNRGNLNAHKNNLHLKESFHRCDHPGCSFVTRYKSSLSKHKQNRHTASLKAFLESLDVSELYTGSGLHSE